MNQAYIGDKPMSTKLGIILMFYEFPLLFSMRIKSISRGAFTGSHYVLESSYHYILTRTDKSVTVLFLSLCPLSPTLITDQSPRNEYLMHLFPERDSDRG